MLLKLSVHNYALIRELDVEFENGLTIITGETGAGKSILLGALGLILGNRADTGVLLDKSDKCIVEGTFSIDAYDLNDFFSKNNLDYESVSTLRREINPAGKSRAFINDTPVTVNILKDLGDRLIDIHSQHQTLMLNDNTFQLSVIDSFAGTGGLGEDYRKVFSSFIRMKRELEEARAITGKNREDMEYLGYQLNQLEEARLSDGEQDELETELEILEHAEEIKSTLCQASELFSREGESVLSMLREIRVLLGKIRSFHPSGETLYTRTDSSIIELDDLAAEIEKLSSSVEADPGRLEFINNRLDTLYSLIQKHRVKDVKELLDRKEQIRLQLESIVSGDERLAELEKLIVKERQSLQEIAEHISVKRSSVLPEIENRVSDLLKHLGMPNGRFRIRLSKTQDFTLSGTDQADFMFSANRQVEPENIARIASGGELSRVMLSLKSLLTKYNNLPTIIFDEIDSGVSGEVADKVGQILAGMGRYMQVVNITHLPQVASRGKRHYHVYKDDTGDSTYTRVRLLNDDERVLEVARLLSGSEVTDAAIKNARELLESALN